MDGSTIDSPRNVKGAGVGASDVVATSTTSILEDAKGKLGRMHADEEAYLGPPTLQMDDNGEVDITTGQKMLSAVSGSLFTSLIGTPLSRHLYHFTPPSHGHILMTCSYASRCRPCTPPITTQTHRQHLRRNRQTLIDLRRRLPPSSTKPRRHSLLPRSLLHGQQCRSLRCSTRNRYNALC